MRPVCRGAARPGVTRTRRTAPGASDQRYGSKRGLLLAFAEQGAEGAPETFAAARQETASPLAALTTGLIRMTGPIRTREAMANHLAFLQMDLGDADFHRHALEHGRLLRAEIRGLLEEASRRGELGAGVDAARLARAVQVAFNGALLTWAIHGEGTVEAAVREALDTLLSRAT